MMKISVFFIGVILLFVSCDSNEIENNLTLENRGKMLELVKEYNLMPLSPEESSLIDDNIQAITTPEQLKEILENINLVNTSSIYDESVDNQSVALPKIKTRGETGQSTAVISGSNEDGKASVYVDLITPSVVSSTYHLDIFDAFIGYDHIAGSASKSGSTINFTAYGEGVIKIIFEGIELYKFDVTITGYCKSDGSGGKLTKF